MSAKLKIIEDALEACIAEMPDKHKSEVAASDMAKNALGIIKEIKQQALNDGMAPMWKFLRDNN